MANTIRYVTSQHESIIFITLRIYWLYIKYDYFNKTPIISKVESFYAILLVPGYSRNWDDYWGRTKGASAFPQRRWRGPCFMDMVASINHRRGVSLDQKGDRHTWQRVSHKRRIRKVLPRQRIRQKQCLNHIHTKCATQVTRQFIIHGLHWRLEEPRPRSNRVLCHKMIICIS